MAPAPTTTAAPTATVTEPPAPASAPAPIAAVPEVSEPASAPIEPSNQAPVAPAAPQAASGRKHKAVPDADDRV